MKHFARYLYSKLYQSLTNLRWFFRKRALKHRMPGELIVSLTTYGLRFRTLPMTLKCLMTQTVRPDKLILWVTWGDADLITTEVKKFTSFGLEIRFCEDLRSYKKIIPTLIDHPNAFIITADDDLFYHRRWLEELVNEYSGTKSEIICHRARQVLYDNNRKIESYNRWPELKKPTDVNGAIFPTSGAGALYPPGCFHSDVLKVEIFTKLSPNADDLWLYWMHRLNGYNAKKIGQSRRLISWPGSQKSSLKEKNLYAGGNDRQIALLAEHYGMPRE